MKWNEKILERGRNGELLYPGLGKETKRINRADTPFDSGWIPYAIMVACMVVDGAVFLNLFKYISYDKAGLLPVQVAGMLFACDVVPIYMGIQLRRLRTGINDDWFLLVISLIVCVIAFGMNAVLRVLTIGLTVPDSVVDPWTDPGAVANMIFGICLPFLTSLGSFFISYTNYDPLKSAKMKLEMAIFGKKDKIRRQDADLAEYDAMRDKADQLRRDDDAEYKSMETVYRAQVLQYCDYVRQRLKAHLGTPTTTTALSEEEVDRILARLDAGLDSLGLTDPPAQPGGPEPSPVPS